MAPPRQGDLFGSDGADPSDDDFETPEYHADPEKVREELNKILAEARAAQTMPWDARRAALYRTIFPQMTNWLPEEEAGQLRFEFETELARLQAA
jgi:tRNA nucleotidyltransferase/poly(A) polymerase